MLAALLERLARHGGLHALEVYHRPIGAAPPPQDPACRLLGEDEALERCGDPELGLREAAVAGAYARDERCVGAFCGGVLTGYAWFAYGDAPHVNGIRVRVPPQAVYRYKTFVRPAWRGRGIAAALYRAADELVARPDRSHVVNCIAVQNRPSIAAARRSGDARLGYLAYWQAQGRFQALHSPAVNAFGLRFYLAGAG